MSSRSPFVWRELIMPRPLDERHAIEALRRIANDPMAPELVLELRAQAGRTTLLLGGEVASVTRTARLLGAALGDDVSRLPVVTARRLWLTSNVRAFATDDLSFAAKDVHAALSRTRVEEVLVLQLVLGARVGRQEAPREVTVPSTRERLLGRPGSIPERVVIDQVQEKRHEQGFAAVVRLGVASEAESRRRSLLLGLLGALRRLEVPGVGLGLRSERPVCLDDARSPVFWPLRLTVREAVVLGGLPVGDELSGLPSLHPLLLPPRYVLPRSSSERIVTAETIALGTSEMLTLSEAAILRGLHVLGPVGVGKSEALAQLVTQWVNQGRAAVVIEPKRDLSDAVAARIAEEHRGRVVYLDLLSHRGVVGFNPLLLHNQPPELAVDGLVTIFATVLSDVIGVTTRDLLNASLLTLVQFPGATLLMLPKLLADPRFRQQVVAHVAHDVLLQSYWAEFEGKSEQARSQLVAPVLTRLRQLLLRESFRACLGQAAPRFDVRQVFGREKCVLVVPLPEAQLGREGVTLLGSLLVHAIFGAVRERALVPPAARHPVLIAVDEWHRFMRGGEEFAEALTLFRGYGAGFVLANQVMSQLPRELRDIVTGTVRSRIYFQLGYEDAALAARYEPGLEALDFMALDPFHVYASLFEHGKTQGFVSGRTIQLPPPLLDADIVQAASQARYGVPREEVAAEVARLYGDDTGETLRPQQEHPPPGGIGRRRRSTTDKSNEGDSTP